MSILTKDVNTIGSGIISCVPPDLPSLTSVQDKILRIEDNIDIEFNEFIELTRRYPLKFYNTWLSDRVSEFPAPVVLNVRYKCLITPSEHMTLPINLMYIKSYITDKTDLQLLIDYYTTLHIPVAITTKKMFIPHKKNKLVFLHHPPCYQCGKCLMTFFSTNWRVNHENYRTVEDLY